MATAFGEDVRAELEKPEYRDRFFASMQAGLGQCDRTCMRLYAEMHRMVGSQMDLATALMAALGVGVEVARGNVETVERARQMTTRQKCELYAKALRDAGFQVTEPENWSEAEVVENGNGAHG